MAKLPFVGGCLADIVATCNACTYIGFKGHVLGQDAVACWTAVSCRAITIHRQLDLLVQHEAASIAAVLKADL